MPLPGNLVITADRGFGPIASRVHAVGFYCKCALLRCYLIAVYECERITANSASFERFKFHNQVPVCMAYLSLTLLYPKFYLEPGQTSAAIDSTIQDCIDSVT